MHKYCKGNRQENSKIGQIRGGGGLPTFVQAPRVGRRGVERESTLYVSNIYFFLQNWKLLVLYSAMEPVGILIGEVSLVYEFTCCVGRTSASNFVVLFSLTQTYTHSVLMFPRARMFPTARACLHAAARTCSPRVLMSPAASPQRAHVQAHAGSVNSMRASHSFIHSF